MRMRAIVRDHQAYGRRDVLPICLLVALSHRCQIYLNTVGMRGKAEHQHKDVCCHGESCRRG